MKEALVIRICHLAAGQFEGIHPDAVYGALAIEAGSVAHLEPALGNAGHGRRKEVRNLFRSGHELKLAQKLAGWLESCMGSDFTKECAAG